MANEENFRDFLEEFVPQIAAKTRQLYKLIWILETTGLKDAADVKAELDTELRVLYSDIETYEKLLVWKEEEKAPLYQRQLQIILRNFKENMLPKELLLQISQVESEIAQIYSNFRPQFEGKPISENDVKGILKEEKNVTRRKAVWEASKEIGSELAPKVLEIVNLRNKGAKQLGYSNYFQMQLELQEIDQKWLLKFFDELSSKSEEAYSKALDHINETLARKFKVKKEEIGPWAWSEPFCQEDPLNVAELEKLVEGIDILESAKAFFGSFGFDVDGVLSRSDLYERERKNQHAFCINIDRDKKDVRTLNNICPTMGWLETILHELGHAVYELEYNEALPWLLKEPPHMFLTEAIALLCGRQAYNPLFWKEFSILDDEKEKLTFKALESLKRRQLIFSRYVMCMTHFESELYRDPAQDLNKLWWDLVAKYQKITPPKNREGASDWAAKYHISLAPVYYYSYLLGEIFASNLLESLIKWEKEPWNKRGGDFFKHRLFFLGSSLSWQRTVESVLGHSLKIDPWLKEFC